jgi:phosphoenolpyruvate phosphomutase
LSSRKHEQPDILRRIVASLPGPAPTIRMMGDSARLVATVVSFMLGCGTRTIIVSRANALRDLLARSGVVRAVGAHDALSARLIEQAGFEAVWASGFGIAASLKCIPDASLVSSTEQLDIERNIAEAVSVPVIADCDSGYGNALNVIRTVREREQAGLAAICIEDNVFPKVCSLYDGAVRDLVSIEEHCGKIAAAKAAQRSRDFVVIARTEALIAGESPEIAVRRADSYARAGADAVLIHSRSPEFAVVRWVAQAFRGGVPLVAVPTMYDGVTTAELSEAGFKMVIYANQVVRAAIRAMRETLEELREAPRVGAVNGRIATLEDVQELVGVAQMQRDEAHYLAKPSRPESRC